MVKSKDEERICHVVYPLGFAFSYDPTGRESRRTSDPSLSRDRGNATTASPLTPWF